MLFSVTVSMSLFTGSVKIYWSHITKRIVRFFFRKFGNLHNSKRKKDSPHLFWSSWAVLAVLTWMSLSCSGCLAVIVVLFWWRLIFWLSCVGAPVFDALFSLAMDFLVVLPESRGVQHLLQKCSIFRGRTTPFRRTIWYVRDWNSDGKHSLSSSSPILVLYLIFLPTEW